MKLMRTAVLHNLLNRLRVLRNLRSGLSTLAEISRELDIGGTLIFRNPDGTERRVVIPPPEERFPREEEKPEVSYCDCHAVDVKPIEPQTEQALRGWFCFWKETEQYVRLKIPKDFDPSSQEILKIWHAVHDLSPAENLLPCALKSIRERLEEIDGDEK